MGFSGGKFATGNFETLLGFDYSIIYFQKTYLEGDSPETFFSIGRSITITLHKQDIMASSYNFQLRIKATRGMGYFKLQSNLS